jgi:predicted RNase H-like nuclease (RuvC/YqgF family)
MPSYAEEKGLQKRPVKTANEQTVRIKELEKQIKKREKELSEEKEKVEILKKSLHIFMQPQE